MKKYLIFGLKRSGNHAIIEWVASHFRHTRHFNDVTAPKGPNSFREYGDKTLDFDCEIRSVEGEPPFADLGIGSSEETQIAILRDYFNTQASTIRFGRRFPWARDEYKRTKELWPAYAEECLRNSHLFILYNRWVESGSHPSEIENRYGWPEVSLTLDFPASGIGRGSSF